MKGELEKKLQKIFQLKQKPQVKIILNEYGDLASNALFLWSQQNKQAPIEGFKKFKDKLHQEFDSLLEFDFLNGYLNFKIKSDFLFKTFKLALKKPRKIFSNNFGRQQKIIIEFVSANPTGPLHLGNGRNAILGEVISRVLKKVGFRVTKEYYNNDRGNQIKILGLSALNFLGKVKFQDNFYQGDYLKELTFKNKGLCLKYQHQPEYLGYLLSKKILEFMIKPTLKALDVKFDSFFSERKLYPQIYEIVLKKIKKYTYLKDGALWLKLPTKDEVLIKKDGEFTYFLSDILYHYHKFKIRNFKYGINIFGADHLDHARRVKEALYLLGIKEKQLKFIIYQLVYVKKHGQLLKMSKRKGDLILLDDLLKEAGAGSVKFYFLLHPPETHLTFDLDLAKKKTEENLYWYLIYTGARLNSVILKAKKEKRIKRIDNLLDPRKAWEEIKENQFMIEILKRIFLWQDILIEVAKSLEVSLLPQYLVETAKKINQLYEKEIFLDKDLKKMYAKLMFVQVLINFLKDGLETINLEFLEKV